MTTSSSRTYKTRSECRMCRSKNLVLVLDLGKQPLANAFLNTPETEKPEPFFPLRVFLCTDCFLSQLIDVVDPEILFRDYVYFSSGMPVLSEHFRHYAEDVVSRFAKNENDFIVEIGSNDGLLLSAIQNMKRRVLGVDPARNIAEVARKRGVETIAEFFSESLAEHIASTKGKAKAIIGNNVVAHIDDHRDLVGGISKLLDSDGVFVFEAPHLLDMFENLTFDTVYHEHLSYLSVFPLQKFFKKHGFDIIDVKILPVQGSSIRVYVARTGAYPVSPSVEACITQEREAGLQSVDAYKKIAHRIQKLKEDVIATMTRIRGEGGRIGAYGAPAKGNTLLNFFGIGPESISFATEGLPSKIGRFTPGTHIPVVDIAEARKNHPDYYLLLAWNYKHAILEKEKEFRNAGGKFIMPVGAERII